jgi:hypothetical protein
MTIGPIGSPLAPSLSTATLLLALFHAVAMAEDRAQDLRRPVGEERATQPIPITTTVSGEINRPKDRPLTVEYLESAKLTELLRRGLSDEGFRVVDPGTGGAVLVRTRGVLQLTGKHTARIRIAELAEKGTLVEPGDASRALAPADVGYVIAAGNWLNRLVQSGQISAPVGGVLVLDLVGQATGAKDWFNKAVGGDRRGICLINCDNWHKTRQAAFQVIEIQERGATQRVEIRTELLAEDLQPGRVVSEGLATLILALAGKPVPSNVPSGNERANQRE